MAQLQINRKWGYLREFLLPPYSVYLNKKDLTEEIEIEKVVKAKLKPGDYQLSIKTTDRVRMAREVKYDFTISSPDDCIIINLYASKWYIFGVGATLALFITYWLVTPAFKNVSATQLAQSRVALAILGLQMLLLMTAVLIFIVAAVALFYFNRFGIGIRIKSE